MACFTLLRRIECRRSLQGSLAFLCNAPSARSLAYENLGGAGPAGKFQICKVHYMKMVLNMEWVGMSQVQKILQMIRTKKVQSKKAEMKWNELWLSMIDRSQRKLKSHGAASRGIPGYLGFIPGKAGMGDMGEHKPCGHMGKRAELLNYIGKLVEMYRRTCVFNVKMRWENSFDVFSSTVSKSMKTLSLLWFAAGIWE